MNAEQILNVLSNQKFANWYKGNFEQYLIHGSIPKDHIVEDIETLFDIKPIPDIWKPLLKVIPQEQIGDYMYMGTEGSNNIHLYKHCLTRKYINVDINGQCYEYNVFGSIYTQYFAIDKEKALAHANS